MNTADALRQIDRRQVIDAIGKEIKIRLPQIGQLLNVCRIIGAIVHGIDAAAVKADIEQHAVDKGIVQLAAVDGLLVVRQTVGGQHLGEGVTVDVGINALLE